MAPPAPAARIAAIGVGVVGVLYALLDSGVATPEAAPRETSVALGILGLLFGTGAWVMHAGGRPERSPLLAGLSGGLVVYAVARLFL